MREINYKNEERHHNALLYVLADGHLCSTFGFNSCRCALEVLALVCLYSTMLSRIRHAVRVLQEHLKTCNLGNFMVKALTAQVQPWMRRLMAGPKPPS